MTAGDNVVSVRCYVGGQDRLMVQPFVNAGPCSEYRQDGEGLMVLPCG